MLPRVEHLHLSDSLLAGLPYEPASAGPISPLPVPGAPSLKGLPHAGGLFFLGYSAALATRARSASSKASMRRAVAWGDFVKRASML